MMAMVTLRARLQTWLSRAQRIARKGCTARRRESGRSATGVAEGLAMLLMRLAVRLQLLESGRRDRHDPGFLVFVPRGKKTAYNLRTRFIRHLSNATLTPGGPAPRIVHRRILKKRARYPRIEKGPRQTVANRLGVGLPDAIATATTQKILISVHRAHLRTERWLVFGGRR